ncbi:MAG: winged helix-turn-helix transcriptional regulator, partial [Pseudomonadota bacterium]
FLSRRFSDTKSSGHGHPLRPEFRLTEHGLLVADWARTLNGLARSEQDHTLFRAKWSLPLMQSLPEEKRFSDLRRDLVPVTDRALSQCLSRLTSNHWLNRTVSLEVSPPSVSYHPTRTGEIVHSHLMTLPKLAF